MKYVIEELLNLDKPRSKQISPRFANQYNNLKPIRVFITGPPAVGKTFWSKKFIYI